MVGRGHVARGIQAGSGHRQDLTGRDAAVVHAPGPVEQVAHVQDVQGQLDLAAVATVIEEILGELEVEVVLERGLRGEAFGPAAPVGREVAVIADVALEGGGITRGGPVHLADFGRGRDVQQGVAGTAVVVEIDGAFIHRVGEALAAARLVRQGEGRLQAAAEVFRGPVGHDARQLVGLGSMPLVSTEGLPCQLEFATEEVPSLTE